MTDNYDQIIADDAQAGQAAAVTNLDAKADDGAKAIRLSQDTGVPSMAIYNDLPNFQKQYKARLASQILLTHDELNGFVQSHPLAPIVANDDYGNLAKFTSGSKDTSGVVRWLNTYGENRVRAIKENDQFFGEGYGQQPYGSYLDEDLKDSPVTKALVGLTLLPFEMAFRAVGGEATVGMETAGQLVEGVGSTLGLSESSTRLLGRDVRSELQRRMMTGEVPELPETSIRAGNVARARTAGGAPAAAEAIARQQAMDVQVKRLTDIYQAGKQWYDQGLEPPRGVHPDIDASKAERNGIGVQQLMDRLDQAQASNMRQRVPGMFNNLAGLEDLYGNAEIGISGDRVAEIYGQMEPEANDGLLGFVPGIADKLALAREIGEDVGIPIKDWLTYVDPKIAAGLRDDIRMWPEGITAREASPVDLMVADTAEMGVSGGTAPIQYHPMVDSPLAAVRGAAGLEPMFSVGDRKLTLDRTGYPPKELAESLGHNWDDLGSYERQRFINEAGGGRYGPGEGFHNFNLLDQNGKPVGYFNLSEQEGGKELWVHMISGFDGLGVRDFGPSLMIDLAKQIAAEFPEADTLIGHRISGARGKVGIFADASVDLNRFRARFDVPKGWDRVGGMEDFRAILEGGEWQAFHPTVEGYVKAKFDPATIAISNAIKEEFLKRVPKGQVGFVQRLRDVGGDNDRLGGVYLSDRDGRSLVLLATDIYPEAKMGFMHHEAIHALRRLFTDREWMTLEQAAREGDWLGKFDIEGRYGKRGLTQGKKLEESIAEGYRSWEQGRGEVGPRLHPIFQKIKEFLDAIRKRINDILGRPGTVDDIFERVGSGEVGAREGSLYDRMEREAELQMSATREEIGSEDHLRRVAEGHAITPSVDDLKQALIKARQQSVDELGPEMDRKFRDLNRRIDAGGADADAAMREKAELGKSLPQQDEAAYPLNEDTISQLLNEYQSLERRDESPEAHIDGIARVLKRYIGDASNGDPLAGAILRKGIEEVEKSGGTREALSQDVMQRFMADLSPSDQQFMREFMGKKAQFSTDRESIKSAAIKAGGKIYEGTTHPEAYQKAIAEGHETVDDMDGFITNTGRYIDRKEAAEIAIKNEQTSGRSTAEELRKTGFDSLEMGSKPPLVLPKDFVDPIDKYKPQFSVGPSPPALQDQINALKASSMGLTQKTLKDMMGLYEKRYQEDLTKANARARRDEATRQTKEWRNNLGDMRKQVEGDLRRQPDIAADLFFSTGDLFGDKLPKPYRLATEDLTPEQQAALPKHYQAKSGLPPDQVASLFGYTSGDAMIEALARYQEVKGGKSSLEALSQQVKDETSRRMEAKYGDLKSNILAEAHDLAHSETNQQILIAEYHTAAEMMKQPTVDMAMAKELAKEEFDKLQVGSMSSARLRDTMAKHMRAVDRALAAQDYPTAMRALQDRTYAGLLAAMALKREVEITKFQANAKRWGRREPVGIDPTWTNYLHQVLDQSGMRIGRSPADLAKELEARKGGTLQEFVAKAASMKLEVPVPDFLYDKSWRKEFGQLTNAEFEGIDGATKALAHNGREALKINVADQARELSQVINTLNTSLREFPQIPHDVEGQPIGFLKNTKAAQFARQIKANHFKLETLFDHWSRNDPEGSWYQYGLRDLINADYAVEAMRKDYAKKLAAASDKEDMSKLVKNDIWKEPKTNNVLTLNRGNLRAIMLNLGNGAGKKSNLFKLASGYELKPQQIMDWVHSVADKKDWDFVQKIWDIFDELKVESDKMYRGLTGGVPSQSIPAVPIQTPKFGTYKGGYYRIIHHKEFLKEKGEPKTMGLFEPDYTSATVPAGYMIERVVDTDRPMSLSLDAMPNAMSQMIHDIGMRPAVINASKIFFNPKIQQTIFRHYGAEYRDLLEPYLRDVANAANYRSRYQEIGGEVSAFLRANAITTLVGGNIGTVLKHGPTALVLSAKEVKKFFPAFGEVNMGMYSQATRDLLSQSSEVGESLNDFIMRKSREIPHRDVNWIETMGGQTNELVPKGMAALRQQIIRYASKPVAFSDMLSAKPTWLAAYKQFMAENPLLVVDKTDQGAIDFADKAVRRAHGSTMQTAQAGIVRDSNRWLTGVYNFWSTIWQRQAEMAWQAGKTFDLVKEGDWPGAAQASKELGAQFFAYVIWPAIVEELVSPFSNEEHESWGLKAVKGMARSVTASWVGVRDLANAVMYGTDPNIGLATTAAKSMYDLARDMLKTKGPMSKDHAGLTLQHAATLIGMMTGMMPSAVGKAGRFLTDVSSGQQSQPKDPWAWLTGLRYGTLAKHSQSFDDWKKGLIK